MTLCDYEQADVDLHQLHADALTPSLFSYTMGRNVFQQYYIQMLTIGLADE